MCLLFNDPATPEIYTLSLHASLPIGTCPIPAGVKKRVTRTAVSGRYICEDVYSVPAGQIRKCPPRSSSTMAPKTLGESNRGDRKSTRLNSSHANISYAVFCLKKKNYS